MISKNHKIYIFNRPGVTISDSYGADIEYLNAPLLEISSTEIRKMIKKGIPVRYLVTEKVFKEIEENSYYKK